MDIVSQILIFILFVTSVVGISSILLLGSFYINLHLYTAIKTYLKKCIPAP